LVNTRHPLSASDRERIRHAVEAARRSTSAKFDFVIVPASDHYVLFPEVWAIAVALVLTSVLALVKPWLSIGTGFVVSTVLFIAFSVAFEWWPIRVRLVPRAFKRIAARRMARHQFATHLISKDQEHNGVMLFVSLAERHLEIVAERDAHAHVPVGTWDRIVTEATAKMSANLVDGLASAALACGNALAQAFPPRI
jgi:putative membrane protein